jgi:hypothetical protein
MVSSGRFRNHVVKSCGVDKSLSSEASKLKSDKIDAEALQHVRRPGVSHLFVRCL